jgi:hypothetical protein
MHYTIRKVGRARISIGPYMCIYLLDCSMVLAGCASRVCMSIYMDHYVYLIIIVLGDSTLITASARGHSAATIDLPDSVSNCRIYILVDYGGMTYCQPGTTTTISCELLAYSYIARQP